MSLPPIQMTYSGNGVFLASNRLIPTCNQHLGAGEVVMMEVLEERSEVSHRQEFAWLREAWKTLPDNLADLYRSADHLRKAALIATGWCHVRDYPVASRKEAVRLAAALTAELDEYAAVLVEADVVRVCRAKSQARNKMKKADFQASKTAILEWVAALLEVEPEVLSSQGAGSAEQASRQAVAA